MFWEGKACIKEEGGLIDPRESEKGIDPALLWLLLRLLYFRKRGLELEKEGPSAKEILDRDMFSEKASLLKGEVG